MCPMRVILLAISVLIAGITLYCSNKDADAQRLLDKDIELSKNSKVSRVGRISSATNFVADCLTGKYLYKTIRSCWTSLPASKPRLSIQPAAS
jgi:hypothetical protein